MLRRLFCYLCLTFFMVALSEAVEESTTTDPRLSPVAAAYSNWLNMAGLSQPSNGWELKVEKLIEVRCAEDGKKIEFHLGGGIDCRDRSSPVPHFILLIKFKHPDKIWHNAPDGWEVLNSQFYASKNVSLNERLLFKLSHLLDERIEAVRIHMQTYCIDWDLQSVQGEVRKVDGMSCKMVGERTLITKTLTAEAANAIANSSLTRVSEISFNGARIAEFFDRHFGPKNVAIKKVAIEDQYVEVILSGLRGEVIEGTKYWERLQSSVLVADRGDYFELRLLLDGQFAAGLNPPPITAFSDMEPVYSKSLQVYAGQLLASLKEYLLEKNRRND